LRQSTDRILVSYAGILPRPEYLNELIDGGISLEAATGTEYHQRLPQAIQDVVDRQVLLGVDIVNDGEFAKAGSYGGYMVDRVTGYSTVPEDPARPPKRAGTSERDRRQFPGFYDSGLWFSGSGGPIRPGFATQGGMRSPNQRAPRVCTSAVTYSGQTAVQADVDHIRAAIHGRDVEGYIAALGPLSLGAGVRNEHYSSEEEYMMAVAEACREEYKTITDAGLIVQVDEPEFCTSWTFYPDWNVNDLRKYLSFCVEVINRSIQGLPEDLVRFHTCWGSGHRPS